MWSAGASEKPAVLFLHDFLIDGTFGWNMQIEFFTKESNAFIPNLVFFDGLSLTLTEKTEAFQADCMVKMIHT